MGNYLYDNFFGKYRILVPIDQRTNDFPRNPDHKIETDDFYIACKKSGKYIGEISHYKDDILQALVFTQRSPQNYKLIQKCEEKGIPVFDFLEGDGEFSFKFYAKDMEFIGGYLGASTQGKNIRPFSIKNLPKSNYKIPDDDLKRYKEICSCVDEIIYIAKTTDEFLNENFDKVERDLRLHKMSRMKKEYIHMKGLWESYLNYLKRKLLK